MASVLSEDKTSHTNKEKVYRYKVTARGVLLTILIAQSTYESLISF